MAPESTQWVPGREVTVLGLETEYGILGAEPEDVVAACLDAEGEAGRSRGVRWDYSGEYPLRDARGFEMDRAAADPSMLTDIPGAASVEAPVPGRVRTTAVVRLTAQEEAWQRGTATCVGTGGRLYVDHGHPEYATPECTGAAQAVLADRAGDLLVARGAEQLRRRGVKARLFKNNVDGKGATYGTHENYLVPRALDFNDLVQALVPLLVVRPLLVGSGRVGTGAVAQGADFQVSQRADYLERIVGLGTTVDRPLVNTRDESHTDPRRWRRLHLVAGDANCFGTIAWLKLGMTALVLQVLADGVPAAWRHLRLADPVTQARDVSRDTRLQDTLELADGRRLSALEILEHYLQTVRSHLKDRGRPAPAPPGDPLRPDLAALADGADTDGVETGAILAFWEASLASLRDLAWSELSPTGRGLAERVPAGVDARGGLSDEVVEAALAEPPATTRAWLRGRLVSAFPGQVVAAGWHSMVLETGERAQRRLPLTDTLAFTRTATAPALKDAADVVEVLTRLTGERPGDPGRAAEAVTTSATLSGEQT